MRLLTIVFFFFLALSFSQTIIKKENTYLQDYLIADKYFNDAEKLRFQKNYSEEKEEQINKQALNIFQRIGPAITKGANDSLVFFYHLKSGILWHYFDSIQLAKSEYIKAVALKEKIPAIADSFLFQPLLFTGRIYYSLNEFDSAYIFYKKAESINESYQNTLQEQERLYNGLGSMYYETGNYKQAKNYFEKATSLLSSKAPFYKDFFVQYQNNIASSLAKIEKFAAADSIYESILAFNINTSAILQNIGIINLRLGNEKKALTYFKKLHYNNDLNIGLYTHLGKAYFMLGQSDSAAYYFSMAFKENKKWNGNKKTTKHGYTFQCQAEKFYNEKEYEKSISNFQQAILQYYPSYNETDIYKNPDNFSGVFSYIDLFNVLTQKANAFENLYKQDRKQQSLVAALNAYSAAFKLAEYVERTYESDEARLFLNKIKYNVHDNPIRISLQLHELTKNKMYLEEAYNFDQQNKASILSLNVQEQTLKSQLGYNSNLFKEEFILKTNITRLSIKAAQISDSSQLQKISASIRDNEIELGKLGEKINEMPGYKAQKFAQSIPTVVQLQKILDKKTALLSYHLAKNELVILCITANELSYYKQAVDSTFFNSIELLKGSLNNFSGEKQYDGAALSVQLYNATIKPIGDKIKNVETLLIIPDDELNNLPFEALQDAEGKYLLEIFTVQYQYSTALLRDDIKKRGVNKGTLAMAPFSNTGNGLFAQLKYSKNEVENVEGNILLDNVATKKRFLAGADKYGILHLATHTIVNDTLPEQSLIAFYPATDVPQNENNLYVQEIYNLKLDSTKLVILSACETGTGKLAKGEGLMSLARAFTYAGCSNIIASLWKADDKSTAWIIQRFYHHQLNGTTAAAALQKSKLDYIQSSDIEKRFKTPNYWAHLVLNGIPEKKSNSFIWLLIAAIIATLTIALIYFAKKRKSSFI